MGLAGEPSCSLRHLASISGDSATLHGCQGRVGRKPDRKGIHRDQVRAPAERRPCGAEWPGTRPGHAASVGGSRGKTSVMSPTAIDTHNHRERHPPRVRALSRPALWLGSWTYNMSDRRAVTLACIVLAHRAPEQVALLLSALRHPRPGPTCTSIDAFPQGPFTQALAQAGLHDVVLLPRYAGRWGGLGIVDATLERPRPEHGRRVRLLHPPKRAGLSAAPDGRDAGFRPRRPPRAATSRTSHCPPPAGASGGAIAPTSTPIIFWVGARRASPGVRT